MTLHPLIPLWAWAVVFVPLLGLAVWQLVVALRGASRGAAGRQGTPEEVEYRDVVEAGGGLYFLAGDPQAVEGMVEDVVAQQAVELDASPEVIVTDLPTLWFLVGTAGTALLLIVAWRLRE